MEEARPQHWQPDSQSGLSTFANAPLHLEFLSLVSLQNILSGHQPNRRILCNASADSQARDSTRSSPLPPRTLFSLSDQFEDFSVTFQCVPPATCSEMENSFSLTYKESISHSWPLTFGILSCMGIVDDIKTLFFCRCFRREGILLVSTE